jgi:SAM-dependent methyltransferase
MTTSTTCAARYALGQDWDQEYDRLELLQRVFDKFATSRLLALGIGPGARCLELGGGAGSIAGWMCHRVGPDGHVTATDLDTKWLERLDAQNLSVTRHDLTSEGFPEGSFDFIHARAVFEHIADREAVLDRVGRWLAPGGWLFLEDYAFFPIDSAATPAYRHALHALEAMLAQTGTDYRWPRTFPVPLSRRRLRKADAEFHIELVRGGEDLAEFLRLTLEYLRCRMLEAQLITEGQLDDACALLRDPNLVELGPAYAGAWAQRPS